jgi:hypothetical protein
LLTISQSHRDVMRKARRRTAAYAGIFLLPLMGAMPAAGRAQDQQADPPQTLSANPSPSAAPAAQPAETGAESGILESPKRILDVIPNFVTVNDTRANQGPLTSRQKYQLAWVSTYDISAHLGDLLQASIQQWTNGEPHYGRNLSAFGKRFAASEGDQAVSEFFIRGLWPSLLKEDPRYFRGGKGPVWDRVSRAVTRAFVIRTDSGGHTFNFPYVLGQFMQAGISNLYYPRQDRSASGTVKDVGINFGYNAAGNILKEYYPDLVNKLKRKHATTSP